MKKILCGLSILLLLTGCVGQGKLKPYDIEAQISKSGLDVDADNNNAEEAYVDSSGERDDKIEDVHHSPRYKFEMHRIGPMHIISPPKKSLPLEGIYDDVRYGAVPGIEPVSPRR